MIKRCVLTVGIGLFFLFAATMGYGASWLLNSNSSDLPENLEALINQAGGTLVRTLDEVGIAVAEFSSREEAQAMEAYGLAVMPDLTVSIPEEAPMSSIGSDETYYSYQWHLPVIEADKAWDEGITGAGVRVAILDSGIWYYHPDLDDNIDYEASTTFVPDTTDFYDDNWHGTHVAGIVAAEDNDWGTIGVAPNATLIIVKVTNSSGSGHYSWILAGIIHAVNHNADIINMSLGNTIRKSGYSPYYTAKEAQEVIRAWRKVINWASNKALVVCSAGNDFLDLDHDSNLITVPAQIGTAIAISATAPVGQQDFDTPTTYTNYGKSAIWVAAPGGDYVVSVLDGVLSTYPGGWAWASGTSQAAPMVSGVAALILEKYGPMSRAKLKNYLARTADDLGKPGKDEWYGHGRINAYKAVTR